MGLERHFRTEGVGPPPQVLLCLEGVSVSRYLHAGPGPAPGLLCSPSLLLPTRKNSLWALTRIRQDADPGMKVADSPVPVITQLS